MNTLFVLWALVLGASAWGGVSAPPTRRAENFVVHDLRGPRPAPLDFKTEEGKGIVRLDIDVLVLSAERIKRALCRELDLSTRGWGKIHLFLTTTADTVQNISIVPTLFLDGWQYRVEVPDRLEDRKLIRGIVQVLLLEFANRAGSPKSAEIPIWLNEGVSSQLRSLVGPDLILQSVPVGSVVRSMRTVEGVDSLGEARQALRSSSAVTIDELSRPALEHLTGENFKRYQSSAQLFVAELCRLPKGRTCLVNMLRELPSCWNWETAFLRSFQRYFQRKLDIEKWWSVTVLNFTGRDPTQVWPPDICMERLDQILLVPAQVRLTPEALPVRTYVTPQQIVAEWEYPIQKVALEQTLHRLNLLKFNCPLEAAALLEHYRPMWNADERARYLEGAALLERYRLTFQNYLQKRAEASSGSGTKRPMTISIPLLVRETVQRLDELYRQREALHREVASVSATSNKP